jgi:hypothetical protein
VNENEPVVEEIVSNLTERVYPVAEHDTEAN